jgi:hypothetical protein
MTLTVVYNPTYSSIINISGVDMIFDIDDMGNTINIKDTNRPVDVWMVSGTMCNVQWINTFVSRNNMYGRCLPDPDDPLGYSLSDVTGTITGQSVYSSAGAPVPSVLLESTTSLYYQVTTSANVTTLYRKGLGGHSEYDDALTCSGTARGDYFASIQEGKLFGLAKVGSQMLLNLYNFNDNTITTLYTGTAKSNETWVSNTVIGNPGAEKLVAASWYLVSGSIDNAHLRVFDAHTGSFIQEDDIVFGLVTGKEIEFCYNISPQIFSGTVVAYSLQEQWLAPSTYPYVPPFRYWNSVVLTYHVDTRAHGIGRVQNEGEVFTGLTTVEAGIDYATGLYFFVDYKSDAGTGWIETLLYKAGVFGTPTPVLVRGLAENDYIKFVTGKSKLYGVSYLSGNIELMNSSSVIGSVPTGVTIPATTLFLAHQLDETDQRVWFLNSTTGSAFLGASVIGSSDKLIQIANGTVFVDSPILTMNLVKKGVALTSKNLLGKLSLIQ